MHQADWLESHRRRLGWSKLETARRAGVSQRMVNEISLRKRIVSPHSIVLARLENAFGAKFGDVSTQPSQMWFTRHPREFVRIMEIVMELGVDALPALEALQKAVTSASAPSPSRTQGSTEDRPASPARTSSAHTKKTAS